MEKVHIIWVYCNYCDCLIHVQQEILIPSNWDFLRNVENEHESQWSSEETTLIQCIAQLVSHVNGSMINC